MKPTKLCWKPGCKNNYIAQLSLKLDSRKIRDKTEARLCSEHMGGIIGIVHEHIDAHRERLVKEQEAK